MPRFSIAYKTTWLTEILNRLKELAETDDAIWKAIKALQEFDVKAGNRLTKLEKKMPSFLDHKPTVTDDGYDIGVEVWTTARMERKHFGSATITPKARPFEAKR